MDNSAIDANAGHILLSFDDAYAPHAATLCNSLMLNNPHRALCFHILYRALGEASREIFRNWLEEKKQRVSFYAVPDAVCAFFLLQDNAHVSEAAYYRLLCGELLPKHITRVLYLDPDCVNLKNLDELWTLDIQGYALAAVLGGAPPERKKSLGLAKDAPYLQSGVLLINLKYWRDNNITEELLEYLRTQTQALERHDQDILNAVLPGCWLRLPQKYNSQRYFHYNVSSETMFKELPSEEITEARESAVILHFTGVGQWKPWYADSLSPRKDIYAAYRRDTPYGNTPLPAYRDQAIMEGSFPLTAPLLICGGPASGKGVLAALLEGHPDIFCIPMWHDCTAAQLGYCREIKGPLAPVEQRWQDYAKYLDFFKALNNVQNAYEVLQIAAYAGYMHFSLDAQRSVPVPFSFSFSRFSEGLCADVSGMNFVDFPGLFHAVFKNLHVQITDGGKPPPRYGASIMPVDFFRYSLLRSMYPEAKCLFVRREPLDAFAAFIAKNAQQHGQPVEECMHKYCTSAKALRIVKNMLYAEYFAVEQPDFMAILDFSDLILNTEHCLCKACAHIGVEYLPILQQATFLGKPVAPDVTGVVHDDPQSLMSEAQLDKLKKYIAYLRLQAKRELGA